MNEHNIKLDNLEYHNWDYSCDNWIPEKTNKNISEYFKHSSDEQVGQYFVWLNNNHQHFLFKFRDFIFPRLVEHQHFAVANDLLDNKIYQFDESIAKSSAFRLALEFDKVGFDYWISKVTTLTQHEQSSVYKKFWEEFLTYQFQKNEEIITNLNHLDYVLGKVPFYINSDYDILNSYLMKSRESFFNNKFDNLQSDLKLIVVQKIAMLCGKYYPDSKTIFQEEFEQFPHAIVIFDKTVSYEKLNKLLDNKSLPPKKLVKKSKI